MGGCVSSVNPGGGAGAGFGSGFGSSFGAGVGRPPVFWRDVELGSKLGQGSYGEVRAVVSERERLDRHAVKVLSLSSRLAEDLGRTETESDPEVDDLEDYDALDFNEEEEEYDDEDASTSGGSDPAGVIGGPGGGKLTAASRTSSASRVLGAALAAPRGLFSRFAEDAGEEPMCDIDRSRLEQARREVAIWKKMGKHRHCVELHFAFMRGAEFFIVMERCHGSVEDIRTSLSKGPEHCIADVVEQMTRGLAHLHARGIVHRDVKPENFLLGGGVGGGVGDPLATVVKLSDFGLAARAPRRRGELLGGICGTVPFMSPEMVGDIGHTLSTDIWSLGITVYLLLFQEYPYMPPVGDGESLKDAVKRSILLGSPAPLFMPSDMRLRHPSEAAISFVRLLLRRCVPHKRPTAQQVQRLPFLRHHYGHPLK